MSNILSRQNIKPIYVNNSILNKTQFQINLFSYN